MWEGLARTRRQDRALHGLAKLANVLVAPFVVFWWLLGQRLRAPLRRLLDRFDSTPPMRPVPVERERSMDSLMRDLERIPCRLAPDPRAELRKGARDAVPFVLSLFRQTVNLGYAYPEQFTFMPFAGADGERIAASVAVHEGAPRPGIVVVHGLFSTRRLDYVREIAVRAFFEWGFNVAAIDLRSHGLTELTSDAPTTAGWKEGEDVIACARWLKQLGSTSVGALGISLGASSVMGACHPAGAEEALDGGVLAICGPADTRWATDHIGSDPPPGHRFHRYAPFFHAMLVTRRRNIRWPGSRWDFRAPLVERSAPHYGVSLEEIFERSSAENHIAAARVPVLVLHGADDAVVPVEHAERLRAAARGSDLVRVWVVPGGGHAAFDAVDPAWTWAVYRAFFERWARYRPSEETTNLVYSAADGGHIGADGQ